MSMKDLEKVLIKGDLQTLSEADRITYYMKVCETVGLNPLTQPFAYLELNRKLVLYATRTATDQLRKIHKVSIKITSRETVGEVYVVTAQARLPDGREDESTGAVTITGLRGDPLANAYLKCETKAKRRVTLSICGLGLMDELEVETIPGAKVHTPNISPASIAEPPGPKSQQASSGPGLIKVVDPNTKFTAGANTGKTYGDFYLMDQSQEFKYAYELRRKIKETPDWAKNLNPSIYGYVIFCEEQGVYDSAK